MKFLKITNIFSRAKIKYDNYYSLYCNNIIFRNTSSNLEILLTPTSNEEDNEKEKEKQQQQQEYNNYTTTPTFTDYKKFIINNFQVDENEANILIHRSNKFLQIPLNTINDNCNICRMENIDMKHGLTNIKFLELDEQQLIDRITLLKEMGAKYITTTMIARCGGSTNVASFKAFAKIPSNENICKKLYSYLHVPPCNVPELNLLSETLSMNQYRKLILSHYIKWRLEFSDDQDKLLKLVTTKLLYKSFANIKNSFDVLYYDYGLPIKIIRTKRCLENSCGIDLKKILYELKTICDVSIKNLLIKFPQLHKMKYKNVSVAKKLLEKYNFTNIQLENCPDILLVDADNLITGIEAINNISELKIISDHPSILKIVLTKDGISNRIYYLKYLGFTHSLTIKILGSPINKFDAFLKDTRKTYKHNDIFIELAQQIGIDYLKLKIELKKHSLWKRANIISAHNTCKYLMNNFQIQDICQNLQLLLYSREQVEYMYIDLLKINESLNQEERYTPCQLLAMCIYKIEKKYHFTGEGIWQLTPEFQTIQQNHDDNDNEQYTQYQYHQYHDDNYDNQDQSKQQKYT